MYSALYAACKTNDVLTVQQILTDAQLTRVSAECLSAGGQVSVSGGRMPSGVSAGEQVSVSGGRMPSGVSRLLLCRHESTTLLHVASQSSSGAVVRLLLQHGADPSLKYASVSTIHIYTSYIVLLLVFITNYSFRVLMLLVG